MIPIFVVDRPASLRILSELDVKRHKFGILSHPYTSENFKKFFHDFRCDVKVSDSGIYQGDTLGYAELFAEYQKMGADYGIIKDYYRDRRKTRESALNGLLIYKKLGYEKHFKLIGVAQGNSVAEYLQSYREQRNMGYKIVAIGGLLETMPPEIKIAAIRARSNVLVENVLDAIRREYPRDRLFPLGVFTKRRFDLFQKYNVWVSDYKGWIFRYDIEQSKRNNDRFKQVTSYLEREIFARLESQRDEQERRNNRDSDRTRRLLIMACGKTKSETPGKAIEVYLGPSFRIVKNYLKTNNHLDVKIISAKYGIIDYRDKIIPYDLKLNKKISSVYATVASHYASEWKVKYDDIFVIGGVNYQSVIPDDLGATRAVGKIGQQLSELKNWLESRPDAMSSPRMVAKRSS